jgi:hypothetical protein
MRPAKGLPHSHRNGSRPGGFECTRAISGTTQAAETRRQYQGTWSEISHSKYAEAFTMTTITLRRLRPGFPAWRTRMQFGALRDYTESKTVTAVLSD